MWLALLEVAPDEPPARTAPPMAELAARMDLLDAHRTRSDYAAIGQLLPELLLDLHAAAVGPGGQQALRWLVDATHTARGTFRGLGRLAEATLAAERCVPLAVADWARANVAAPAPARTGGRRPSPHGPPTSWATTWPKPAPWRC